MTVDFLLHFREHLQFTFAQYELCLVTMPSVALCAIPHVRFQFVFMLLYNLKIKSHEINRRFSHQSHVIHCRLICDDYI